MTKLAILDPAELQQMLIQAAQKGAQMAIAEMKSGQAGPVLSVAQAAKFLGIGSGTLRAYVDARTIPHFRVGRLIKFRTSELLEWQPPIKFDGIPADDPAVLAYERRQSRRASARSSTSSPKDFK